MTRTSLPALACLLLAGCVSNTLSSQTMQLSPGGGVPTQAPAARPTMRVTSTAMLAAARLITVHKTTTAGATLSLAGPQALGPDCRPSGPVVVKVTTPPDHGAVHVAQGMIFSNYKPGDPPYPCNARKTSATLVSYQAVAGFVGEDVAVIQVFFPNGQAPMIRYNITVN